LVTKPKIRYGNPPHKTYWIPIPDRNNPPTANLKGVLYGVASVIPEFTKQKSGQIITSSSVPGIKSFPNAGVYGATKFAVRNLMEVIRMVSFTPF
jgi:NADP-dependent 3-hydroxy acid dehydrogenase YdfG